MSVILRGNKVFLKPLEKEDSKLLHEYTKEKELNEYSGPYNSSESLEKANEYVEKCNEKMKNGEGYFFGIFSKDNILVGSIGLFNINMEKKSGEVGFWTAKEYWGNGFMSEALNLVLNFSFDELEIIKILAAFHEKNIGSKKILLKNGFNEESVDKEYSEIVYSKLKN